MLVSEAFVDRLRTQTSSPVMTPVNRFNSTIHMLDPEYLQQKIRTFDHMDISDCIATYQLSYVPNYTTFLLVSKAGFQLPYNTTDTIYDSWANSPGQKALPASCQLESDGQITTKLQSNNSSVEPCLLDSAGAGWKFEEFNPTTNLVDKTTPIDYCLTEKISPSCSIQVNKALLIVVVLSNSVKVIVLLMMTVLLVDFHPIATLGDAIDSFLKQSDPTTLGYGPVSAKDIKRMKSNLRGSGNSIADSELCHGRKWKAECQNWGNLISRRLYASFLMV